MSEPRDIMSKTMMQSVANILYKEVMVAYRKRKGFLQRLRGMVINLLYLLYLRFNKYVL